MSSPTHRLRPLGLLAAVWALLLSTGVPARASNDPLFPRQWALAQIGAEQAAGVANGAGVTIGVVDTGVDLGHEDMQGKVAATALCDNGTCRDGGGQDDNGHGTHISGVAAAATGNGKGIAGVAPGARLVVAKALDGAGEGTVEDINAAIHWLVDRHRPQVLNLSLGEAPDLIGSLLGGFLGGNQGPTLRDGVEYAWARGTVPVVASGNDGGSPNFGGLNAVVVGATDRNGNQAAYSSSVSSAKWGILAPGGSGGSPGSAGFADNNIVSTWLPNRYASMAGTSMAAPHVSGGLALLMSRGMGREAAISRLMETAAPVAGCGGGCHGRVDLARAMGAGSAPPPATGGSSGPVAAGGASRSAGAAPARTPTTRPATPARASATPAASGATTTTTVVAAPPPPPPDTTSTSALEPPPPPLDLSERALPRPGQARDRNVAVILGAFGLLSGVTLAVGRVGLARLRGGG